MPEITNTVVGKIAETMLRGFVEAAGQQVAGCGDHCARPKAETTVFVRLFSYESPIRSLFVARESLVVGHEGIAVCKIVELSSLEGEQVGTQTAIVASDSLPFLLIGFEP